MAEREKTGYGKVRLRKHLKAKYSLIIKEDVVGKILKRNPVRKQSYRRPPESKPLYNYEALPPFEDGHIDTKHIDDFGALRKMVFNLRRYNLPLYRWTYVCAKTKTRFPAYSYSLDSPYGRLFLGLVITWLGACGVKTEMTFQGDNGPE
ncbi:hypothetical protein COY07_06555 [Candidatus Peregrinibacteria bacterium CG_4_10_14_0_2_um_filter_43_11]|nr:MAG: hypothetical protein COY07_06555 [Candidatus Peregrinibacteria bacterium CG_4_10_14_0_2_um_filter_43_11]